MPLAQPVIGCLFSNGGCQCLRPSQNWLPNLILAGNQNNRIQYKYRDCLQQITTVFIIFVHVTFALVLFVLPSFRLNWKSDFILMIFQYITFYSILSRPANNYLLLGTWFINPNPTAKSGKKWPKLARFDPKMAKINQKQSKSVKKYPKSAGVTIKILLIPKSAGYTFKILLLVFKPTGLDVPRCRNNLELWFFLCTNSLPSLTIINLYIS